MTNYTRHPGRECPSSPDSPADQPYPPGDGTGCCPIPEPETPTTEKPKGCDPDPHCKCPTTPGSGSKCLELLIEKQTTTAPPADQTNGLKTKLQKLLESSRKASQAYSRDMYDK